ncbi:hypothetical protein BJY52DRAFT_1221402 [Lactarius psammicola]|nr:hypothetical protein BJY52DRAFT_1221402 [Lactarius psammicola]
MTVFASIKAKAAEQITSNKALSTHKWFSSSTAYMLEIYFIALLSAHPTSKSLSCIAVESSPSTLEIPMQNANPGDFEAIRRDVPSSFLKSRKWYHVFVTNDKGMAKKLGNQKRKDPPGGIIICSAVFDVDWLGSIHGRLVEMSKERERTQNTPIMFFDPAVRYSAHFVLATHPITDPNICIRGVPWVLVHTTGRHRQSPIHAMYWSGYWKADTKLAARVYIAFKQATSFTNALGRHISFEIVELVLRGYSRHYECLQPFPISQHSTHLPNNYLRQRHDDLSSFKECFQRQGGGNRLPGEWGTGRASDVEWRVEGVGMDDENRMRA